MKVGIVASLRGRDQYGHHYETIINHLEKKGHTAIHSLHIKMEEILKLPSPERDIYFNKFYKKLLKEADVILVECSFSSMNVGYGTAFLVHNGKPVVAIYVEGSHGAGFGVDYLNNEDDRITVLSYKEDELANTLEYVLKLLETKVDRRFTMVFPSRLMAKLEEISIRKKLPKAVFIRQAIENALASEEL